MMFPLKIVDWTVTACNIQDVKLWFRGTQHFWGVYHERRKNFIYSV